jgi:hypothetical protein
MAVLKCDDCGGLLVVNRNRLTCTQCGLIKFYNRRFDNVTPVKKLNKVAHPKKELYIEDVISLRELYAKWDPDLKEFE